MDQSAVTHLLTFWFTCCLLHRRPPLSPAGTFPMQSERFYQALKGHGANCRLVLLPHESHGYSARESILHTLYEMDRCAATCIHQHKTAACLCGPWLAIGR
jgi:hypothetical protein